MNLQYRFIQGTAALLGLMYLKSGYDFIITKQIEFIHYTAISSLEIWTVRNLGARLLAISVGFLAALFLNDRRMLALMFLVRLTADIRDFFNSMNTAGLDSFVVPVLGAFVCIETLCLLMLMKIIAQEGKK